MQMQSSNRISFDNGRLSAAVRISYRPRTLLLYRLLWFIGYLTMLDKLQIVWRLVR
jgi:hypothetical protein